MRISALTFHLVILIQVAAISQELPIPPILTSSKAEAIVYQEMRLAAQREKERLRSIHAAPALSTWQIGRTTPKITMRRLAPKTWPVKPAPVVGEWTEEQKAEWRDSRQDFRTMQLSATVFDRKLSELQWRKGALDFTVLSNIDFNYISMIGWLESGQTHWSTFFFVSNIDSEREQSYARKAMEKGEVYTPQTVPDGSMLKSDRPDYVIYAKPGEEVPTDLVEEMDALHQHYAINEQALKVAWQNRQEMNEALRAWHEANPPIPRDTVINFWPVRSRTNGKN
ncbi:MAG: hypothetical protein WEB53_07750 [Akkermansiaceae bacterium]